MTLSMVARGVRIPFIGLLALLFELLVLLKSVHSADFNITVDGVLVSNAYDKPFGGKVEMTCGLPGWNSTGLIRFRWFNVRNDDVQTLPDPNIDISSNGEVLIISNLQKRHDGRWACQRRTCIDLTQPISTCSARTDTGYAYINVHQPPSAKIEGSPYHVIAGESLLINCLLGGESRNVTFYLNNKPVHYGGDSGRYQKAKVTGADQGIIKCVNHHVKLDMTASASAQVVVYEPPVVEMTPKVVKVYSGTTVNLTCQGVSIDPDVEPVVLSISKGTIPSCFRTQYLQEGPFSATGPTANAVLPFPAIGRFDSGWYYCEATTPYLLGCSDSKSKQAMKVDVVDRPPTSELSVVFGDPPLIRIAGYGADKVVNDELIFSCDAKLFQIDLLLQKLWYHNGVLLDVLTNPDLGFGHNNGTLTFRSFKASMAGLYSCTVNYLGFPDINVTRTAPLEVFIQEPPKTSVISETSTYSVGDDFSATCLMDVGNGAKMKVEWRRRVGNLSYPVPHSLISSTAAVLHMENLNVRDTGEYLCVGTDPDIVYKPLQSHASYLTLSVKKEDVVTSTSTATNLDIMVVTTTAASGADNSQQSQDPSAEKELGASAGSRVTDDKLYFTIAIVGSAVAVILAIFVFVLLAYIRRRTSAVAVVARQAKDKETAVKENSNEDSSNGVSRPTKLMIVNMTENTQYESVILATQTSSDEKRKDCVTLASHDDGIADCSQAETDVETGSGVGINMRTSGHVAKMASSNSKGSFDTDTDAGDGMSTRFASEVESEHYSEPFDRSVQARTSIRSFASAMKEEGSRTPRGYVVLRPGKKAGLSDGDTYSLPRDASIQVIDPDMDSQYTAPVDQRRHSTIIPVDDYSTPVEGRSTNELFSRTSSRAKTIRVIGRHASVSSGHINSATSAIGALRNRGQEDSSRSPSPVDESLYSEPYAEPPASVDAIYNTMRKNQRYRDIWPDNVTLENELGSGRFGNVYRGVWTENSTSRQVAVKTLKDGVNPHERLLFLQEAAIMGQFRHKNLVRLYGVVTQGSTLMLVEELMCSDNLRQYLLKRRPDDDGLPQEMQLSLVTMCKGIADGMSYLAQRGFVHRDLAARNIMLDSDRTCKIGDFGMSRGMESDHYESSGGVIPVKWSAPEAIEYRSFSSASDVWSYGIVLYEIWTFGKCPYPWWDNEMVMVKLREGYRLPRPDYCPPALYNLMKDCWEESKGDRPTFQQVLQRLDGPPEVLLRMPKALSVKKKAQDPSPDHSSPDGTSSGEPEESTTAVSSSSGNVGQS